MNLPEVFQVLSQLPPGVEARLNEGALSEREGIGRGLWANAETERETPAYQPRSENALRLKDASQNSEPQACSNGLIAVNWPRAERSKVSVSYEAAEPLVLDHPKAFKTRLSGRSELQKHQERLAAMLLYPRNERDVVGLPQIEEK